MLFEVLGRFDTPVSSSWVPALNIASELPVGWGVRRLTISSSAHASALFFLLCRQIRGRRIRGHTVRSAGCRGSRRSIYQGGGSIRCSQPPFRTVRERRTRITPPTLLPTALWRDVCLRCNHNMVRARCHSINGRWRPYPAARASPPPFIHSSLIIYIYMFTHV